MNSDWTRRRFLEMTASGALAMAAPAASAKTAPGFEEYRRHDAMGLAALVRKGDASPMELLELAIARAEAVNPKINAIVVEHFELAREAVRKGLPKGPLRGVPYLLKDLGTSMRGTITTEGSRFFRDKRHAEDSTLVERYRAAGLSLFGKTHSSEFGSTPSSESVLHGQTRNPWDPTRSAGGSSGGSAAAVAAGIVPAAHATDGGGSIRIPASSCGLVGLKPSRGRVPMGPAVYEGWGGLSTAHCVSRSVRDSAALLDATQGAAIGDAYAAPPRERLYIDEIGRDPGRLRIALMTEPLLPIPVAEECVDAALKAARLCESLGHVVEQASPSIDAIGLWGAMGPTTMVGVATKVADREAELGRKAGPEDLEAINLLNVASGRKVTGLEHAQARRTLHAGSRTLGEFMRSYDVILSPTMGMLPPPLGTLSLEQPYEDFVGPVSQSSCFAALFNMTGQPAMSMPLSWTAAGVPVGVMIAARYGDESTLFRLAGQIETAEPWFDRVPRLGLA